jgi:hypothetical protein
MHYYTRQRTEAKFHIRAPAASFPGKITHLTHCTADCGGRGPSGAEPSDKDIILCPYRDSNLGGQPVSSFLYGRNYISCYMACYNVA